MSVLPIHLGAFQLQTPIRKGGMGEVWRGVHVGQDLPVAIKVMTGKRARNPRYLKAFRNEVQAVAALEHTGIVLIFDHGKIPPEAESRSKGRFVAGSPYLVMELASGGSLDQSTKQLPWFELKGLIISLLDALAHAHARGVLHRDLKPANVLICSLYDPRPGLKLTDFGLATPGDFDEQREGTTERMAGTPRYMAPEVFDGRWRDYGPWTDLYALGCMVYEMVTRRPMFEGKTSAELRRQHSYEPAPRLRARKTLPEDFDRWLLRLVEKQPEARYRSAADAAWGLLNLGDPENPGLTPSVNKPGVFRSTTTLPSALTGVTHFDPGTTQLGPEATHINDTNLFALQELQSSPTYILAESGIHGAPTYIMPSVESLASHATMSFEPKGERANASAASPPSPSPSSHFRRRLASSGDAETVEALPVERAPMPPNWHRNDTAATTMAMRGVGLSLYGLRPPKLVGRYKERQLIWDALREVHATGQARLVLLEGHQGVGKSRLAEWIGERAQEVGAATVLRANHSPLPGPTDGLPRMIGRHLRCLGLNRADARRRVRRILQREGVDREYEWDALTELMTAPMDRQSIARAKIVRFTSPNERYALVRRMLKHTAKERPVIIWLDDVQWGNDALWFAQYLLRMQARHPLPVLLLMTAVDDHLAERAMEAHILEQVMTSPAARRIHMGPLNDEEHGELVGQLLGLESDLAAWVQRTTGGNPMFAVQLIGSWVTQGVLEVGAQGFTLKRGAHLHAPGDVIEVWRERVDALVDDLKDDTQQTPTFPRAREVLELAAVLGMNIDAMEWREVCEKSGLTLSVELLQVIVTSGLVQPGEGTFAFTHALARQVLEDSARHHKRWANHNQACVNMLEARYPDTPAGIAQRLGRHLVEAEDISRALKPLLEGAIERADAGEYRLAIELLDQRDWAMMNLSSSNSLSQWGEGWLLRAQIYNTMGRVEEGYEWARYAMEGAQRHQWKEQEHPAMAETALLATMTGRLETSQELSQTLRRHARATRDRAALSQVFFIEGQRAKIQGHLPDACHWTRQALLGHQRLGDKMGSARCLLALWAMVLQRGELRLANDLLEQAQQIYHKTGHQLGDTYCQQAQGLMAVIRGRFAQGADLLQRALGFFEVMGVSHGTAACLEGLARLDEGRQDFSAAVTWWARAEELRRDAGSVYALDTCMHRALALLCANRVDEGAELLTEVMGSDEVQDRLLVLAQGHLGHMFIAAQRADWDAWDHHVVQATSLLAETSLVTPRAAMIAARAAEQAREQSKTRRALEGYVLTLQQWQALRQKRKIQELKAVMRVLLETQASTP